MEKLLKLSRNQRGEGELIRRAFYYTQSLPKHASKGNVKAVCYMVKHTPTRAHLNRALILSVKGLYLNVIEVLVRAGADVHVRNDEALCRAAYYGHLEMVQCLLRAGADVHAQENYALRRAACIGRLQLVHCLLGAGADVHARDGGVLRLAAKHGHVEVVQCLLRAGAYHDHLEAV